MGFLRQQGHQSPAAITRFNGLQIQSSSNSVPITILYGANRIAPNVIWTGGFYAVPQYQKSGGKGGGGGQQLQGYTYYTSFLLGICEGPINNYIVTYENQGGLLRPVRDWTEPSNGRHDAASPMGIFAGKLPRPSAWL
jgi:hypothetical protein